MDVLPETGREYSIRIYIEHNRVYLLLDLSGEPLHWRGYRLSGGAAPMRETLAAVLLQCMQWKRKLPLHDAFAVRVPSRLKRRGMPIISRPESAAALPLKPLPVIRLKRPAAY